MKKNSSKKQENFLNEIAIDCPGTFSLLGFDKCIIGTHMNKKDPNNFKVIFVYDWDKLIDTLMDRGMTESDSMTFVDKLSFYCNENNSAIISMRYTDEHS